MKTATPGLVTESFDKSDINSKEASFDFDRWAVEVRKQMIASLQKRTVRYDNS